MPTYLSVNVDVFIGFEEKTRDDIESPLVYMQAGSCPYTQKSIAL
jgi:hypothetical protein